MKKKIENTKNDIYRERVMIMLKDINNDEYLKKIYTLVKFLYKL